MCWPASQHFHDIFIVGKFGVVFCSFPSLSSFLFLLRPVSVQVLAAWFDVYVYVQVDLEGICFHDLFLVVPVF